MDKAITAALLLFAAGPVLAAQDLYKCKRADDQLVYQDHPCGAGSQDQGGLAGGYATPLSGSGTASHWNKERGSAGLHAGRRHEAEERSHQADPQAAQIEQEDYRRHVCQAEHDAELGQHRAATFSCDLHGNKLPLPAAETTAEPQTIPVRR